ncbi:hypothetical protein RI129_008516 [Pyrocoelia pectoralis]|uniref:PIN domain-containing protein n=1 Tax=Pyrocoelia pectoralis TaxID=417401 RepID=A0AAN7VFE4_9COLE
MNYNNGRQMRGQMHNGNKNLNRKRKLNRPQQFSKRFRYTNNPSLDILPFSNPLNHATVQNSDKVPSETVIYPQFLHKSPTNDQPVPRNIQSVLSIDQPKPQTSPYDPFKPRISPLKPRTSPSDPSKPPSGTYSANDRLKSLKKTFGVVSDVVQPLAKNNNSCSNFTRWENPKPSLTAKPSTIQERLKNMKKNYYNNANSTGLTTSCTTKPQEDMILISPPNSAACVNDVSDEESMDWCAFEHKEVLDNITKLRKNVTPHTAPLTTFQKTISETLINMTVNQSMYRQIFIVVDTNVFLSNLDLVNELLDFKINVSGVSNPCIMIPWIVIQELDYLKDSDRQSNINNSAQNAIKFINEKLAKKDPQVKGQSVRDAADQNFTSKNADDAILFCCLQIQDRQHNSILLSNDINLRNKAMINGVTAYSHRTIMDGLDPYRDTGSGMKLHPAFDYSKLKAVDVIFSAFFSFIINKKTLDAYGSLRDRMYPQLKQSSQWPLIKCLNFFKTFWRSIFSMFLPRQSMYTVNQFIEFLTKHEDLDAMTPSNIKTFIDTGLELIVYIENGCESNKGSAITSRKKIEDITKDFFVSQN